MGLSDKISEQPVDEDKVSAQNYNPQKREAHSDIIGVTQKS